MRFRRPVDCRPTAVWSQRFDLNVEDGSASPLLAIVSSDMRMHCKSLPCTNYGICETQFNTFGIFSIGVARRGCDSDNVGSFFASVAVHMSGARYPRYSNRPGSARFAASSARFSNVFIVLSRN